MGQRVRKGEIKGKGMIREREGGLRFKFEEGYEAGIRERQGVRTE